MSQPYRIPRIEGRCPKEHIRLQAIECEEFRGYWEDVGKIYATQSALLPKK